MFTAGPAMSSTRAVPGDNSFSISATAIGIEPVAQMYIGSDRMMTNIMLSYGLSENDAKNVSGTNAVISPATINPTINHLPMS